MAGFRARTSDPVDLRVVPYPAVTVAVDFSDDPVTLEDASGRRQRGSAVAGIAPGELRARGRDVECLQVRLSPVVAHAVLGGGAPESSATVVALDDLWGREAERITERLHESDSWAERFEVASAAVGQRVEAGRPVDREVAFAWARIVRSGGQVRVDQLATELGWSRKRLWSRSDRSSVSPRSTRRSWCGSTTPPTCWPPDTARPGSRPRPATSSSPTSIATSWRSPA
jgi:hypothetical protein